MRYLPTQITLEIAAKENTVPTPASVAERARQSAAVLRLLPAEDRRLVEMLLIGGLTQRAVAVALRLDAGVVARRGRRLRNMLACPTTRAIAEHLDTLAEPSRRIAIDYFFTRLSVCLMAEHRGLTRRHVQQQIDFIRGWARALHRAHAIASDAVEDDSGGPHSRR